VRRGLLANQMSGSKSDARDDHTLFLPQANVDEDVRRDLRARFDPFDLVIR
jgi:hypothetical protein